MNKALERQRSAEAARKTRIFNTRQRVMGVDREALNQQVQERKYQQNIEKQRDKVFDMQRLCQDEILLQQDMNEKEKQKALHRDLANHWATQKVLKGHFDADLKCSLKGAVKISIPEADLGPASMQILERDDTGWEEKEKEKKKRAARDLQAQMYENKRGQMEDKQRETLEHKKLLLQDQRRVEQAALEEDRRKADCIALGNYNQALAAEQARYLEHQHRREERENLAEILHTMTSDMMTECAEAAERDMGDGRLPKIFPDRWKGMRPEQLSTIYREQEQQRLERQGQRHAEKIQAAAWDFNLLSIKTEEKSAEKLRREQRIQVDQFNMQLAREQQACHEFLNKKLYTNKPTKDYFNQFNRSSR